MGRTESRHAVRPVGMWGKGEAYAPIIRSRAPARTSRRYRCGSGGWVIRPRVTASRAVYLIDDAPAHPARTPASATNCPIIGRFAVLSSECAEPHHLLPQNAPRHRQRRRLRTATKGIRAPGPESPPSLELDDRGIAPERAAGEQQEAADDEPPSAVTVGAGCLGILLWMRGVCAHAGILTYGATDELASDLWYHSPTQSSLLISGATHL
jgi:hypothetical protein